MSIFVIASIILQDRRMLSRRKAYVDRSESDEQIWRTNHIRFAPSLSSCQHSDESPVARP